MGRRRKKVIRIPKKRLPKYFDCPKCGSRTISIVISEAKTAIAKVTCGKCGESVTKNVAGNKADFFCSRCNRKIVTISLISTNIVKVTCGSCGTTNFHEITGQETLFNCSCGSQQGRFLFHPAKRLAMIHCGKCGLKEYIEPRPSDQPVDLYGRFYDGYYGIHRPPPPPKKESYLDTLRSEVKRMPISHEVESISTINNGQKKIFKRMAETEKQERKLRREA